MKKAFSALMLAVLLLLLCGCSVGSENDRKFMVSALGFEADDGLIRVTAEIININSENPESQPFARVLTAVGKTIDGAIEGISSSLPRNLLFEHCGVLAIGDKMTPAVLNEICNYCFSENRITLSAYMISTEAPEELLSAGTQTSAAVGYDIMGIIKQQTRVKEIKSGSRYFEIEARREKGLKSYSMPFFIVSDDGVKWDGTALFYEDEKKLVLSGRDELLYSVLNGKFENVTALNCDESVTRCKIGYAYNSSGDGCIRLKLNFTDTPTDEIYSLKDEFEAFVRRTKATSEEDVLGITDMLVLHKPALYGDFGGDFREFYRKSDFCTEVS